MLVRNSTCWCVCRPPYPVSHFLCPLTFAVFDTQCMRSPCTKFPAAAAAGTGQQTRAPMLKKNTCNQFRSFPQTYAHNALHLIPGQRCANKEYRVHPLAAVTNPTSLCYNRYKSPRQGCDQTKRILSAPVMGFNNPSMYTTAGTPFPALSTA